MKYNIAQRLFNRGVDLIRSFQSTGNLLNLFTAISVNQQVVRLTPEGHPDRPIRVNNLVISLQYRFECIGDVSDLDEAILIQQRAVQLTPDGHLTMPMQLNNLGLSYQIRFGRTASPSDISEAISNQTRAVQLTPDGHPDMPTWLNSLGNSFCSRFESTGNLPDLSEAITMQLQAVQLTPNGHPDMPGRLNDLGGSLHSRFEHTGNHSDLSEAISNQQKVVRLTPEGHPDMPGRLNNLGLSFRSRFEYTGDMADLSEAISNQQRAVQLTPEGHPDIPRELNSLGISFYSRFGRTGNLSDLLEAISNLRRAVQLTPNGHPHMPLHLNNLGTSFKRRFESTGNPSDLSEAISNQLQAVQLTPNGHPDMPMWLNNLGNSFHSRFGRTGDLSDLSEAISNQQQAVQLTPDGHPHMPGRLNSLGISFRSRFELTGDLVNLSEAISNQQQSVELTPDGHPDIPKWLNNLGTSFQCRFEHTANPTDICNAASTFQKSATTSGTPSFRLHAAQKWAKLSMTHDLPHPLTAYGLAIDLISEIAGMDSTIEQRHGHLINIPSLTTSAVSAAFTLDEVTKALEWLEQGRCLVWNQLNQLRTPLNRLRAHDEHLAQRFSDIAGALEVSGSRSGSGGLSVDALLSQKISLQDEAHRHVMLSRQWTELLDEIRTIPQFRDFLRPPQTSDLMKHLPRDGIIILVNVDEARCDALALVFGSEIPVHITLDYFTHKEASDLRERLRRFLSSHRVRMREPDRGGRPTRRPDSEKQGELHFVLEALWLRVVRPILDGLAFSVSVSKCILYHLLIYFPKTTPPSDPARIWWCPTGSLAFLPLHAAGIYAQNGQSQPGSCISDFAVSSYTPTVSSLLQKIKVSDDVQQPASSKLLIVSQPNTPGCSPIPATTEEMNCVWKTIGSYNGECRRIEGESASVNQVILEMESHGSIHFACHASQSLENPLKSGFYLHDGRLELSEIMKQ